MLAVHPNMGTAGSKYCTETCAPQQSKSRFAPFSQVCCKEDVDDQNIRPRNLLVSSGKKRGVSKVTEHRWKSVASTDHDYCLDGRQSSAFPCDCSWGHQSQGRDSEHHGSDERKTNDIGGISMRSDWKNDSIESTHGAVPPGWSLEEFGRLKDAIEHACHDQHVHYPSYAASQV